MKCAIYARYSTDMQRAESIDAQIRKCRAFAQLKGWEVLDEHIYSDEAVSGASINGRQNFQRMIESAKHKPKPFDYILADDTKRFARDVVTLKSSFKILQFNGVNIYFVSEGIDTTQKAADFLLTIYGGIGENDLQYIAQTTHRGLESQFLKGFNAGGRAYGYRSEPVFGDKLDRFGKPVPIGYRRTIDPDEAKVVRRIFKEYANGRSPRVITKGLNDDGIPPQRTGVKGTKTWCYLTICGDSRRQTGILNNELYRGRYIWNRTRWVKNPETGRRTPFQRPREEWNTIDMPQLRIVSDEVWQRVKDRQKRIGEITTRKNYQNTKEEYAKYLFTGLLRCKCGGNYVVISSGAGNPYYGCSAHRNKGNTVCDNQLYVRESVLMKSILPFFKDEIMNRYTDTLVAKVNKLVSKIVDKSDYREREAIESLRKVNGEWENIKKAIIMGAITETTAVMLKDTEAKKKNFEAELSQIRALKDEPPVRVSKNEIQEYITNFDQTLSKNTTLARSELRKHLGDIELEPKVDRKGRDMLQANITIDPQSILAVWYKKLRMIKYIAGAGFEPATLRL